MDPIHGNRATVEVGGVRYEIDPSNIARRIYADRFVEEDAKADLGYTGDLIHDLLHESTRKIPEWPGWDSIPRVLAAIWAMARAAGSTSATYEEFCDELDHAPANLYEARLAMTTVMLLGESTFFRIQEGLGDAAQPDAGEDGRRDRAGA